MFDVPLTLFGLSPLRWLGLALGAVALLVVFRRLRSEAASRLDVWLLAGFGLGMIVVSLFPGVTKLPADLIDLADVRGGRIMTLLFISTVLLWLLLIHERGKALQLELAVNELVSSLAVRTFASEQVGRLTPDSILLIIPAYNEAANLPAVLPRVPAEMHGRRLLSLVVNDGSTDETEAVAARLGAAVISLPINRGTGTALRTGLLVAQRLGVRYVVTMDADGQHQPEEIADLVKPLLDDAADMVIGSRLLGSQDGATPLRSAGLRLFNWMINTAMNTRITDCTSGFRAYKVSTLSALRMKEKQTYTAEIIIEAAKKRARIVERPISIKPRLSGTSKKGPGWYYGFRFLVAIVKAWLR